MKYIDTLAVPLATNPREPTIRYAQETGVPVAPAPAVPDDFGLARFLRSATANGYVYQPPVAEGVAGARLRRNGKDLVNFASISFMGFQEDPKVLDKFCTSALQYGLVTGGSRMTQGVCGAHSLLEQCMNEVTGRGYTLTFGSGMLANVGFLNAMTTRFAFDDDCAIDNRDAVVVMDHDSHWSLWKGASHLSYGKNLHAFKHNDPSSLDTVLASIQAPKKIVVFESVYSSDGSVAPIGALLDVCEKHGALSYVDDANGFLVYGYPQRPYFEEYQALRRATFLMVSFSKSVGLEGGAISGPRDHVMSLEYLSGTSLFTAAMQPATAATALHLISKLHRSPDLIEGYLGRVERLRQLLRQAGFELYDTASYILSVKVGNDQVAENVRRHLGEAGFTVPVFRYPAVRRNKAVIRLILNNGHSDEEIDRFIAALREARQAYPF